VDRLTLYHRLPGPLRQAAAGVHGRRLRAWRYGPETDDLVAAARAREAWDRDRWEEWAAARTGAALARARTVPGYTSPGGDDLGSWPRLGKAALRADPKAFLVADHGDLYEEHTSGTTGTPVTVWWDRAAVRGWYALVEARARGWHGVSRQDRWAIVGGQLVVPGDRRRPPYWVWNTPLHQLYLSAWHLSPATAGDYAGALRRAKPTHLLGYPSALATLARLCLAGGHELPALTVVLTNAEPLHDDQRTVVAEAFACAVRDTYGLAELVAGASECEAGTQHLWPEVGVVEAVDGELVATGLLNEAMPLVRYGTGDRLARPVAWDRCPCGRGLPVLPPVEGRDDDVVVTPDGRRLGRLDPLFKADLPLVEAQVEQVSVDRLVVRLVPARPLDDRDREQLVRRIRQHVGPMEVEVVEVERIERDAAGKFRAVISRLERA
jgi:phenylacetate-coenzyme A ligase PaaK-like adenylate-forming protein